MRRQKRPSENFSDGLSGIGKPLIFRLRCIPFLDDVAVGVNRDVAGMGGGGLRGGIRRRRCLLRFGLRRFFLFFLVFFFFLSSPSGMAALITAPVPFTASLPAVTTVVAAKSTAAPTTQPLRMRQAAKGVRFFSFISGRTRNDRRVRVRCNLRRLHAMNRRRRQIFPLRRTRRFLPIQPVPLDSARLRPRNKGGRAGCRERAGRRYRRAMRASNRWRFAQTRNRDGWFHRRCRPASVRRFRVGR